MLRQSATITRAEGTGADGKSYFWVAVFNHSGDPHVVDFADTF